MNPAMPPDSQPATGATPLALMESSTAFDTVLGASVAAGLPLLLTFTGPKCMICRQLAPMLSVVVREAGDRLASARADAEALPDLSERYAVRSLPTTLLFRNGLVVDRIAGFATAGSLRDWLAKHAVTLASRH